MKILTTLLAVSLLSSAVFADQAQDIQRVLNLAHQKVRGDKIRKSVSIYNNTEGNPCAESGINYIVKVEYKRSHRALTDNGVNVQESWDELNTYYISKASLDAGEDISDAQCVE